MALALTLLGSGPALAQDVALIPPDERQQELWRYVLKLGDGTRAMKLPAVRLVELT